MGKQAKVNLTIDEEVVKTAKELGLNMSKIAENALKEYIRRLEGSKTQTNGGTPFLSEVSFGKEDSWCGRRDLNPGRRRGRPRS